MRDVGSATDGGDDDASEETDEGEEVDEEEDNELLSEEAQLRAQMEADLAKLGFSDVEVASYLNEHADTLLGGDPGGGSARGRVVGGMREGQQEASSSSFNGGDEGEPSSGGLHWEPAQLGDRLGARRR